MKLNINQQLLDLSNLFRSKTLRDTGLVFAGNLAGQGLGFLATVIVIRHLGPAGFGLFSTAIAVMGLASQFSDLGISTGFVRYAALYLKQDQLKADILFKITLYLKLGIGLIVLIIGLVISKPLAHCLFKAPELTVLLRLAFIGSLGATLWGYLQAILQAKEWFLKYAWINVFNNSIKLVGILILVLYNQLSALNAMWILTLVPFAGFFVDSLIVPKGFLKSKGLPEEHKLVFSELFHLSKWVTLSTLCTMFLMRLEVFMLQALSTPENVGIYNSANQLATIFPLITGSMTIALLPKISSYKTRPDLINYINKVIKVIPVVIIIFIPMFVLSDYLIPALFGAKYTSSIDVFKVLLSAFAVSVILNPISMVFYSINRLQLLSMLNIIQLLIAAPLNYYTITHFGAIGASYTSLSIRLFALSYITYWLFSYFKKGDQLYENKHFG